MEDVLIDNDYCLLIDSCGEFYLFDKSKIDPKFFTCRQLAIDAANTLTSTYQSKNTSVCTQ